MWLIIHLECIGVEFRVGLATYTSVKYNPKRHLDEDILYN